MKITPDTTPQKIWDYHFEFLEPFDQMVASGEIPDHDKLLKVLVHLQVHVDRQAKHYADENFRQGIRLKAAEARIAELTRGVAKLQHRQDVVKQARVDAKD